MEEDIKLIPLDTSALSLEVIEILLFDSTVEPSLLEEIAHKNAHRPEILRYLLNHPNTPEDTRQFVAQTLQLPVPHVAEETPEEPVSEEIKYKHRTQSLLQRIQKLKVGERIQLALKGGREIRSILLRDTNKEVMLSVLDNPKISESEIELIAKQKTTPDEIIRTIAKKKEWLKNYSIAYAIVTNPKTPIAISLKYMYNLKLKDLLMLEKDKNIPGAIRETAKKVAAARKPT